MADRTLVNNVEVDGVYYGPAFPDNEVTDEVLAKITNEAAFEPEPPPRDLRYTAEDFATPDEPVEPTFAFTAAPPPEPTPKPRGRPRKALG